MRIHEMTIMLSIAIRAIRGKTKNLLRDLNIKLYREYECLVPIEPT